MGSDSTKRQAYRQRCIEKGLCPHCGQPCAPYYECEKRRSYKRIHSLVVRMVKAGAIIKGPDGYSMGHGEYPGCKDVLESDVRLLPRIGKKPITVEQLVIDALLEIGTFATEAEITERVVARRLREKNT